MVRPKPTGDLRLKRVKSELSKFSELLLVAKDATNAANRQKTVVKNAIVDMVGQDHIHSAIVLGDVAVAFRPNVTTEIDPRQWYDLYRKGKISDNQFFGALRISTEEAKKAVGEDQLPDISFETLTNTPDLRIIPIPADEVGKRKPGTLIPFAGVGVPTGKEAKQRIVTPPAPAHTSSPGKSGKKIVVRSKTRV